MSYYGDFRAGQSVRCRFNSADPSTGAPATIASATVVVTKDGAVVTPSGGVTLTIDVSSVTGFHHVVVDTSADPSTFTAGSEYAVRLSAGTCGGVSVVGTIVGEFSIANRAVASDANGRVPVQVGTGAGQLNASGGKVPATLASTDVTGNVAANLVQILGTTLTETAGQIAAAFRKFFNVGTPASTMDHLTLVDTVTTYTGNTPQTGDAFGRLGAPTGASIAADIQTRLAASAYTGVLLDAGSVSASPSPTTTTFTATGTGNGLNAPSGGYTVAPMCVMWQTGALANGRSKYPITGHVVSGGNHAFTVSGMPVAPTATDTFVLG